MATSLDNMLGQPSGSATQLNSYELDFSVPVTDLSFYRVTLLAGPTGTIFPQWSATFYNGPTALGSVGESLAGYFTTVPAEQFSLPGTGNRLVFQGDAYGSAGYDNVIIDDLAYTNVPEPT